MKKLFAFALVAGATIGFAMAQSPESIDAAKAAEAGAAQQSEADFFGPQPVKAPWVVDWGASASPTAVAELDGSDNLALATIGSSLWLRMSLPAKGQLYVKAKDTLVLTLYPQPAAGEGFTHLWDIDAAYYRLSLPGLGLTAHAGRKPFVLGSGLVLAGTGDGLDVQWVSPFLTVNAFGLYSGFMRPDYSSWTMSAWDAANGPRRVMAGGGATATLGNHGFSLLGLYQYDLGADAASLYRSWYAGAQAKGVLLTGEYQLEGWYQGGASPQAGSSAAISAFAGRAGYTLFFKAPLSPSVSVSYALASGDADRSAAASAAGNAAGNDNGFQGFGSVGSGSVLRPDFGNLQIVQAGVTLNPLESGPSWLRKTNVGLKYFYYMKYDANGVISDGEAVLPVLDVGHGIDATLRWGPLSDLSVTASGGAFIPGAAYATGEPIRYSASVGLSLSF